MWRFKGKDLKTTTKHRIEIYNDGNHRMTLSLRVMDITYADYGNYTCVAQNKLGTDEEIMILHGKNMNFHKVGVSSKVTSVIRTEVVRLKSASNIFLICKVVNINTNLRCLIFCSKYFRVVNIIKNSGLFFVQHSFYHKDYVFLIYQY